MYPELSLHVLYVRYVLMTMYSHPVEHIFGNMTSIVAGPLLLV